MILAGDIGGTKCNLALMEQDGHAFKVFFRAHYPSQHFASFADVLSAFLNDARETLAPSAAGKILAAGFGVAGPVMGSSAHLTNLNWNLERGAIERQLGTTKVALLNDLEATGYCLPWLKPEELYVLQAGSPPHESHCALIAAGTGLGEAMLRWNGQRYIVEPSEGGHCDLAPRTDREIELLRFMKRTPGPVSCEMILSGRGFYSVHQFLAPDVQHAGFEQNGAGSAPEITKRGLEGSCSVCVETLDVWTALYGAEAGNLALKGLAFGGVFVAGGIAPKILPKLKDGTFARAFCEKAKFAERLSQTPIRIVLNEEATLFGCAAEASRLLG